MNNNTKFLNFLRIGKKAGNIEEGYNKAENAIMKKSVFLVFISPDLSVNSKNKFYNYASKYNFSIIEDAPMDEIGVALGSPNLKVLGVKDSKFCKNLKSLYYEYKTAGGE